VRYVIVLIIVLLLCDFSAEALYGTSRQASAEAFRSKALRSHFV
jgi:hypothetical protein